MSSTSRFLTSPVFIALACLLPLSLLHAQEPVVSTDINAAGMAIYEETCSSCHDMPVETKSPPIDTLKRMGPRAVRYALTNGKMKVQAAALSENDIDNVVAYLSATADVDNSWISDNICPSRAHGCGYRRAHHLDPGL